MRKDRSFNQMREISFEKNVNIHADGSCLVKFGNTHVLCLASIDEKVPHWLKNTGKGWVTAEYGMLPRSTNTRMDREAARGKRPLCCRLGARGFSQFVECVSEGGD